jgi:hypothetical protein
MFEALVGVLLKSYSIALPPSVWTTTLMTICEPQAFVWDRMHLTDIRVQVIGLIFLTTLLFVSDRLFTLLQGLLAPAVGFLDRWLPCIFMPYIVAAALCSIPTGIQLIKAFVFIVSSFILVL